MLPLQGMYLLEREMKAFAAASVPAIGLSFYHGYCHAKGIPHSGLEHHALIAAPILIHTLAEGLTGAAVGWTDCKEDLSLEQMISEKYGTAEAEQELQHQALYQNVMCLSRAGVFGAFTGGLGTIAGAVETGLGTSLGYAVGIIAGHLT